MFDQEVMPEELTVMAMGRVVRKRCPDLDSEDQEAVRQHAVVAMNQIRKVKEEALKQAAEAAYTPREERLLVSLAEIERFVEAHGRRLGSSNGCNISNPDAGPLFAANAADASKSGAIYIMRSRSDHPLINEHREGAHKIGVTAGKEEARIAGAETSATYLLATVEIVATYGSLA